MLKVVAKMAFAPEEIKAAMPLVEELLAATVKQDGCISYQFCKDLEGEGAYAMMETWKDNEALEAHLQSEDFARLSPQLDAHITGGPQMAVYEVLL